MSPALRPNEIQWEDPPPPPTRGGAAVETFTPELVAALHRRPGNWARIREFDGRGSAQSWVKDAQKKSRVPAHIEVIGRGLPGAKGSGVWARSTRARPEAG